VVGAFVDEAAGKEVLRDTCGNARRELIPPRPAESAARIPDRSLGSHTPHGRRAVVPRTVNEWTLESLKHLLEQRYFEPEAFDYKSMLPHSRDDDGKGRLRDACAAFANSAGGFLIFGIADDVRLPPDQRLVGLAPTVDFPVQFGSFPAQVTPSVRWEFRNPAIRLANGSFVHVVWFPRSWNRPHAVGRPEEGLLFPKRTNKGTEFMSYEEVRMNFLGYYEKRLKLQLLQAELQNIMADAQSLVIAPEVAGTQISTTSFRLELLESVLVDTFTILADQTNLLRLLNTIRSTARNVNNKLAMYYPTTGLPITNQEQRCREHNEWLRATIAPITPAARDAMQELQRFLASA
jgi:hypothetical protein